MFLHIWVQKSSPGVMDKSDSHLWYGRLNVLSKWDIILYILERIFLGEGILINSKIGGGMSRLAVWILIFA